VSDSLADLVSRWSDTVSIWFTFIQIIKNRWIGTFIPRDCGNFALSRDFVFMIFLIIFN
jgi:hypothetical protein